MIAVLILYVWFALVIAGLILQNRKWLALNETPQIDVKAYILFSLSSFLALILFAFIAISSLLMSKNIETGQLGFISSALTSINLIMALICLYNFVLCVKVLNMKLSNKSENLL